MSQPLEFVTPGQPFQPSAAAWNSFVETARDVRAGRVIFKVPKDGDGGGGDDSGAIGRALTAISAADSNLTGSAFTFIKFVTDPDIDPQTDPQTLVEETDDDGEVIETDGVNRSTHITAGVDAFVQCKWVNGEWVLDFAEDACPE